MTLLVFLLFAIPFSTLSSQTLQRNWGVEYKDSVQKVYGANIASDKDGNVCISIDSDSSYMYILKYRNTGNIEWNRNSFYNPEVFRRRRIGFGVSSLEYVLEKDIFTYTSILQSKITNRYGKLLIENFKNNDGVSQGFIPSEQGTNLYFPLIIKQSSDSLFFENNLVFQSVPKSTKIVINSFDNFSVKHNSDTILVLDSILSFYSLVDTKINRVSNTIYHLVGYTQVFITPTMFLLSKSDLSKLEDTVNGNVNNQVFSFSSSDLGVPSHSLIVREMLLKDDKIYVCGVSEGVFRKYNPFVATINSKGELIAVDFPFGTDGSMLPRDICFSSDSSSIIFAGETIEIVQSNTIFRPSIKGYSLVTKDTFSFDENDRLGRFLAVTATSNGTIVATGLDLTGGPDFYMYTASYSGIPLSVEDKTTKPQIVVTPNPTTGIIRLGGLEAINGTLTISNIYGQELLKMNDYQNSSSIDVSRLPSGFYFVSYGGKEKLTTSFVLTK